MPKRFDELIDDIRAQGAAYYMVGDTIPGRATAGVFALADLLDAYEVRERAREELMMLTKVHPASFHITLLNRILGTDATQEADHED